MQLGVIVAQGPELMTRRFSPEPHPSEVAISSQKEGIEWKEVMVLLLGLDASVPEEFLGSGVAWTMVGRTP